MRHLALLLPLLLAAACGHNRAPVLDVRDARITLPSGVTPSMEVTRDAILRALAERTWTVDREQPHRIHASVTAGGHSATVEVVYDQDTYSIHHVSSSPGLKYDGYEIHKRYNLWVDNLRKAIDKNLALAAPPAPPPTSGNEAVMPPAEPPTGPVTPPPPGEVPAAARPEAPPAAVDKDLPPAPPPP